MDDKQAFELMKETVVANAKEFYHDGVAPILKPASQALAVIPETILTALYPFRILNLYAKHSIEKTTLLLTKKLENVPPENIVDLEPYIAVPALQQLSYSMDNENLREMYANLLAKAMNKNTKDEVHPSFVEIIKQLSPDDALFIKHVFNEYFVKRSNEPILTVTALAKKQPESNYLKILEQFSDAFEEICLINLQNTSLILDNLERLKLIYETHSGGTFTDRKVDGNRRLENHPYVISTLDTFYKGTNIDNKDNHFRNKGYYLTNLGITFCNICVVDE